MMCLRDDGMTPGMNPRTLETVAVYMLQDYRHFRDDRMDFLDRKGILRTTVAKVRFRSLRGTPFLPGAPPLYVCMYVFLACVPKPLNPKTLDPKPSGFGE